jgi:hypothetical protein
VKTRDFSAKSAVWGGVSPISATGVKVLVAVGLQEFADFHEVAGGGFRLRSHHMATS